MTAAVYNAAKGIIRFWFGNYYVEWSRAATSQAANLSGDAPIGNALSSPGFGASALDESKCRSEGCEFCETDLIYCKKCYSRFRLERGECISTTTISRVTFDDAKTGRQNDDENIEQKGPTFQYKAGLFGTSGFFGGDTKLIMKGLGKLYDWSVSVWIKPLAIPTNNVFLTLNSKSGEQVQIRFAKSTATKFELDVDYLGRNVRCFVASPVTLNDWNKLTVKFDSQSITTGANGFVHRLAFDGEQQQGTDRPTEIDVDSWEIGADINGVNALLDQFEIRVPEKYAPSYTYESGTDAIAEFTERIHILAATFGVVVFLGAVAHYYYVQTIAEQDELGKNSKVTN